MIAEPACADEFSDASRAYVTGNITQARTLWLSLAKSGNAEAAYRLGLLADLGQGTPEDTEAAYRWYRVAASAGNAAAEFNVAVMEDSGRGATHDTADAATWYARAAARGNGRAQYDLGLLYEAGDGVPRNPAAARAWFRQSLAGGLPAAAAKLRGPDIDLNPTPTRSGAGRQVSGVPGDAAQPVIPVSPRAGDVVQTSLDGLTEIVWCAPLQPIPVRYFLQVVTRDGGREHEIRAEYVEVTATLVHLDPAAHRYFWRVFTVSPSGARYVVTPWIAFSSHGLA